MTTLTDQAVEVAIDTACRTLRLPTIRERAAHAEVHPEPWRVSL